MSSSSSSFVQVASCEVAGVAVKKYKSGRTGLVVCLAQVEGPLVNGYFCLATEAHDHDGLPHTLEHLVFMGSEEYPYKGVLDLFANRCLAQGTNAWTDVDHTCYTMTTAGSDGFLNLLPIYIDHILYPTLTDAAFQTEVHHVTGTGEDAGVVYCEMQARENTSEDITHFQLTQHMYPGRCGYKSETGGRLENLRTSCCNEKVCKYHTSYYRPDNLCLVVTGQVKPERLFGALGSIEDKIVSKGVLPPMERPWQSPVPELEESVLKLVQFPTDEEDEGMARIAWRGPSAKDRYGVTSMGCLAVYLSETSVAPLKRELVETGDPFCCDVDSLFLENSESAYGFTFEGVPTEKLEKLPGKVRKVLEGLASGAEEMDMERMSAIINNHILLIRNNVEASPHYFFAVALIGDFLFSQSADQFEIFVDELPRYKQLLSEPSSYWVEMIRKYFVDGPSVVVLGTPSSELASKMTSEEEERTFKQASELGEEGLERKGKELKEAMAKNEIPPPKDLVLSLAIPGTSNIFFHSVVSLSNCLPPSALSDLPEYAKFPVHTLPFFCQLNCIHTEFVEIQVVLDTGVLPPHLLLYVPLYLEMIFESYLVRDGELIPYEQVVKELDADSVDLEAGLGMSGCRFSTGSVPQAAFICMKVEAEKYKVGMAHMKEVLWDIQFVTDRIMTVANKVINDVSSFKRHGSHVAKTMLKQQAYEDSSCPNIANMLSQNSFLTTMLEKLQKSPQEVMGALEEVRRALTSPNNFRLFLTFNPSTFTASELLDPWTSILPQNCSVVPSDLPPIKHVRDTLRTSPVRAQIAGVAGVESNFLALMTPCVTSYLHPDLPAIMVFMEYLSALEGPMWCQIRGQGLSYNYRIACKPDSGQLYFQLFKSAQLVQAYKVAMEIMLAYLNGKSVFEQSSLDAAISGVIFEIIEPEQTVSGAADKAIVNHFRQLGPTYSRDFLGQVATVTVDDLRRVGDLYFTKLFSPSDSVLAVCCSPGKVTEVKRGLEELGVASLTVIDDLSVLASSL